MTKTRTEKEVAAAKFKVEQPAKVGKPGRSAVTGDLVGQTQRLMGKGSRGGFSLAMASGDCGRHGSDD